MRLDELGSIELQPSLTAVGSRSRERASSDRRARLAVRASRVRRARGVRQRRARAARGLEERRRGSRPADDAGPSALPLIGGGRSSAVGVLLGQVSGTGLRAASAPSAGSPTTRARTACWRSPSSWTRPTTTSSASRRRRAEGGLDPAEDGVPRLARRADRRGRERACMTWRRRAAESSLQATRVTRAFRACLGSTPRSRAAARRRCLATRRRPRRPGSRAPEALDAGGRHRRRQRASDRSARMATPPAWWPTSARAGSSWLPTTTLVRKRADRRSPTTHASGSTSPARKAATCSLSRRFERLPASGSRRFPARGAGSRSALLARRSAWRGRAAGGLGPVEVAARPLPPPRREYVDAVSGAMIRAGDPHAAIRAASRGGSRPPRAACRAAARRLGRADPRGCRGGRPRAGGGRGRSAGQAGEGAMLAAAGALAKLSKRT